MEVCLRGRGGLRGGQQWRWAAVLQSRCWRHCKHVRKVGWPHCLQEWLGLQAGAGINSAAMGNWGWRWTWLSQGQSRVSRCPRGSAPRPSRYPWDFPSAACLWHASAMAVGRRRSGERPRDRREVKETAVGMSGKRKMIRFIICSPSAPFLCPLSSFSYILLLQRQCLSQCPINYTNYADDSEYTNSFKPLVLFDSFLANGLNGSFRA